MERRGREDQRRRGRGWCETERMGGGGWCEAKQMERWGLV